MTTMTYKAHLENKSRHKKNSATAGSNKGKPAKHVIVHPDDRPDSNDHGKWAERPFLQTVSGDTNRIRSVKTGEVRSISRGRKVRSRPANE